MSTECFNCSRSVSDRYTLILGSRTVLTDKWLCGPCAGDFREVEWIEVSDSPVLACGDRDWNGDRN